MSNLNDIFNTPDHTSEFDYDDVQNTNVVLTALTYVLFFIPYIFAPNSNYAKFHANQSLVYLIMFVLLSIASSIVCGVISIVPLIGGFVSSLIGILVWIVKATLLLNGIVNALNKQARELPIVGGFTILK